MHQKFSFKKSCEYNSPNYSCSTFIKLSTLDLEVHGNLVCRYLQYNTGILSLSLLTLDSLFINKLTKVKGTIIRGQILGESLKQNSKSPK